MMRKSVFILLLVLSVLEVRPQIVQPISSPANYDPGYEGYPIEMGGKLYMSYRGNDNNYDLFECDPATNNLTAIASPSGFDNAYNGYVGNHSIKIANKLYMKYVGNDDNNDLFEYAPSTGSLTEISSPSGFENGGVGLYSNLIEMGGNLYMRYQGNDYNYDLFEYNIATGILTEISSPSGFDGAHNGYQGDPIVLNGKLYLNYYGNDDNNDLFEYNPSTGSLTEISSPSGFDGSYKGYFGLPIVLSGKLYMHYRGNDDNYDLFEYDPTTGNLTEISSPAGFNQSYAGYEDNPIIASGKLYMRYIGNDNNYDLFEYNPSTSSLTEITSPAGFNLPNAGYSYAKPVEAGGKLYMRYRGNDNNFDLFEYNPSSNSLTEISSPAGFDQSSKGYLQNSIVAFGKLYMRYRGNDNNYDLFEYDPSTGNLTEIASPSGFDGSYKGFQEGIEFNGNLYLRYRPNNSSYSHLFKYNAVSNTLTQIAMPTGFSGYQGQPIIVAGNLYMQYRADDAGLELAVLRLPIQVTWTGSTSSAWNDSTNWSTGSVPRYFDEIIIPDISSLSGNFPTASQNLSLANLTVETGATLNIGAGFGLTNSGSIANNGSIVLNANATGTAYYDDFTNSGVTYSGTGVMEVQQYVTTGSGLGQRLFGSPINNGAVQGLDNSYAGYPTGSLQVDDCANDVLLPTSPYSNLLQWDEQNVSLCDLEGWTAISAGTALTNGRGYSGWMQDGSNISFNGTPNTGNISYGGSLANSNSGVADADGWHVLSNPYPSPITLNELTDQGWSSLQTYNASTGAYSGTFQPITNGQQMGIAQGFVANVPTSTGVASPTENVFESFLDVGNSLNGYSFGLAFDVVNAPVIVNRLGAYDYGGNGLTGVSYVRIYNRNTGTVVVEDTLQGSSHPLENGFRYKNITPTTLPVGQYMVARYSTGEPNRYGGTGSITANNSATNIDFTAGGANYLTSYSSGNTMPSSSYSTSYSALSASFSIQVAPTIPTSAEFANTMRVANGNASFKSGNNWYNAKLDIEVTGNNFADVTYLYYNNSATPQFDIAWDCVKRQSDAGQPTIYTLAQGEQLSLNGQNNTDFGNSIPLGLSPGTNGQFTFTVNGLETLPNSSLVYLEDKLTNTWTNLRETNAYTFNMDVNEQHNRFELHFTKPVELTFAAETCDGNDGSIGVDFGNQSINGNAVDWNYEVKQGTTVLNSGTENNVLALQNLSPGIYEVEFTNGNYTITESIEIENKEQVDAAFTTNVTEVEVGEVLSLSNNSTNATSFEWLIDNQMFNTENANYTFNQAGIYVVTLNVNNEDCADTHSQTITVTNKVTGISEAIALSKVNVYTQGETIIVNLSKAGLTGQTDIGVYDMIGQLITERLKAEQFNRLQLNESANGVYLVKLVNGKEQVTKKVVIK